MHRMDVSKTFLPTDSRWQCTRRSCGSWRSIDLAECKTDPKCPICGGRMEIVPSGQAEAQKSGYYTLFLAVSLTGALVLLSLLVWVTFNSGFMP
jgi:hypothetical protein